MNYRKEMIEKIFIISSATNVKSLLLNEDTRVENDRGADYWYPANFQLGGSFEELERRMQSFGVDTSKMNGFSGYCFPHGEGSKIGSDAVPAFFEIFESEEEEASEKIPDRVIKALQEQVESKGHTFEKIFETHAELQAELAESKLKEEEE